LRFINENQWVSICESAQDDGPIDMLDDLFVEWSWSDAENHASDSAIVSFSQLVAELQERWPHSYQYGIDLIISGSHTVGAEVNMPSKQMRHIAQALPYMLEDQLAQEIGHFHLIHGTRSTEGTLPVLAIPVHLMTVTRRLFEEQGLPLDAIVPDMLCLPHKAGEWTLLVDGKHLLIRQAEMVGIAIEIDAAPVVLASIFDFWQPKPGILRVLLCQDHLNENLKNWIKTQINSAVADQTIEVEYEEIASGYFTVMCDELHRTPRKNPASLLQGNFAAMGRRRPSGYNWKPLAAMVTAFVVMYTGYLYTQSWKLNSEYARLDTEASTLYKRLFPADRKIVNVKRQMEQHIQNFQKGQSGTSFLALLAVTGEQINSINRTHKDAITPQRASYDDGQGDLRLDLTAKDFAQLENFKSRLEAVSLAVETSSAAQDAGVVKARLTIRSQSS
jgi:general secretion pathway protein L